nr:S1C family serine protease [Staphylococcus sp. GDY8P57P]
MDNDKKHVIPREQYRRKRHEYFHNEEREERLAREKAQRERLAQKEQEQAKVNEERVKDNMRKARIEKLTQEEIQQQQHLAKLRSENESEYAADEKEHHLTLPEEQQLKNEDKDNKPIASKSKVETGNKTNEDENELSSNQSDIEPKYSRVEKNKGKTQHASVNKQDAHQCDDVSTYKGEKGASEANTTSDLETRDSEMIEAQDLTTNERYASKQVSTSHQEHKDDEGAAHGNTTRHNSNQTNHEEASEHAHDKSNNNDMMDKVKSFLTLHWLKIVIVVAIILIIILISAIISTINQNSSIEQSSHQNTKYTTTMKNADAAVKSVVTVENDTPKNPTTQTTDKTNINTNSNNEVGSGVVYKAVDDTFFILTNTHIVGNNDKVNITYDDNKAATATVVGKDMWSDIAVLKATINNKNVQPIKIGRSNQLKLGETILVVGNPLGNDFKNTVTKGIVSGLNRAVPVDFDKDNKNDELINTFQIDASVNPGNSGGAVVNQDGELVGVVSLKINMPNIEGMGFAIPIDDARAIASELEKKVKFNILILVLELKMFQSYYHMKEHYLKSLKMFKAEL